MILLFTFWAQAFVDDDGGASRWTPDAFDPSLEPLHEGQMLGTPELPVENITFQVSSTFSIHTSRAVPVHTLEFDWI